MVLSSLDLCDVKKEKKERENIIYINSFFLSFTIVVQPGVIIISWGDSALYTNL